MKQDFDNIEAFRIAMNILTRFHCHVKDHYSREAANQYLHELTEAWHKSEDYVVHTIVQEAMDTVNARGRNFVWKVADKFGFPTGWEDFKACWDGFGNDERHELVKRAVALHSKTTT